MTHITVAIPDAIAQLIKKKSLDSSMIISGFKEALRSQITTEKKNLNEAKSRVATFEKKYKCAFKVFERKQMKHTDSPELHEDYNDWYFWLSVYEQAQERIESYKKIGGVI